MSHVWYDLHTYDYAYNDLRVHMCKHPVCASTSRVICLRASIDGSYHERWGAGVEYFQEFNENGSRPHIYIHIYATHIYHERWGAGVEYHFQEFNEPYAPS